MEEMEMAPPPPPPPPPQPMMLAPVKLPVQTMIHTPIAASVAPIPQQPMVSFFKSIEAVDLKINIPQIKAEKAASRKRRVSSFESSAQNIPPPSKVL
jgi:hypothetical protein